MITLYTWGAGRVFAGTVSADPFGPMPGNSTPTAPPETTGTEVAQWTGSGWVVLPEAPLPPEPPPEPRRLIKKSVVQERLIAEEKLSAVLSVLRSDDAAYARWFAPDHPEVYFDDPGMIQVLTYVGADIPTITAP